MANYFNLIQFNPTNSELSKIANKSCIVLSCVSVGIESLSKHLMIGEELKAKLNSLTAID